MNVTIERIKKNIAIIILETFFCFKFFFVRSVLYEKTNRNIISIRSINQKIQLTIFAANSFIAFVSTQRLLKNCKSDTEFELNNTIDIKTHPISIAVKRSPENIDIIFPKLIFSFFFGHTFFSVFTTLKNNFSQEFEGTVFDNNL